MQGHTAWTGYSSVPAQPSPQPHCVFIKGHGKGHGQPRLLGRMNQVPGPGRRGSGGSRSVLSPTQSPWKATLGLFSLPVTAKHGGL